MPTLTGPGDLVDALTRRRTLAQVAATPGVALDIAWCLRRPQPGHVPGWRAEPYAGSVATGGYRGSPLLVWPPCERGRGLLAWHLAGQTLSTRSPDREVTPRRDWPIQG